MPDVPPLGQCETCRYWDSVKGLCRRRAPVVRPSEKFSESGHWPETRSDDWCGEYEEQPPVDDRSWGV